MAQHDYAIADQSGLSFLADLNNALSAIVSNNSGATEPADTFPYMFWADTNAGILKIRNAADDGWIETISLTGTALESSNNLSDLASAATALTNLGLTATATELNYVDGVTSAIQTQLNNRVQKTSDTGSAIVPSGTEAQRDGSPSAGYTRFNTDSGFLEFYTGTSWVDASVAFSSQAENEAGAVEGKAVDPLGIREAFNAAGSAPVYACRAWVNFDGTGTVAIRASGNVSSITDISAGQYAVNLATAIEDADYVAAGSCSAEYGARQQGALVIDSGGVSEVSPTTTSFRVSAVNTNNVEYDAKYVKIAVFR